MKDNSNKFSKIVPKLAIFLILIGIAWLTLDTVSQVDFPTFKYTIPVWRQLVPAEPYYDIAGHVSRFLWDQRALDLTGQAFVIVAAVVCCLALLKEELGD